MGTAAEIGEIALCIHGNVCSFGHSFDQIKFIHIILELFQSLLTADFMTDNVLGALDALLHFLLNLGQIIIADDIIAKIDIIIETFLNDRTDPEFRLRVKMLDGLRHQMGTAVIEHVQLGIFLEINHVCFPPEN